VKAFGAPLRLPVRAPFRLDLTVDALRRLAGNVVDVVAEDGTFYRALRDGDTSELIAVRARDAESIELRATGRNGARWLGVVARMLGTQVDLRAWYACSRRIVWLAPLASALRGLKPPRYPTLWEACAHAIVFQQLSIHAAASIMRRAVEALGERVTVGAFACFAFPPALRWLDAPDSALRRAGVSRNKIAHLRSAAAAICGGALNEGELESLPTDEVERRLRAIRGIGPWSASVVLLRGLGRLDAFPLRDSGVARSLSLVAGQMHVDQRELLERLGSVRGMLYYHLLLARMGRLRFPTHLE
jgi:DNA-3-methyladenine glycosylase II